MPLYFLLLENAFFERRLRPALADSWRRRSFEEIRPLCKEVMPAVHEFAAKYHIDPGETILAQVADGIPFAREFWTALAGELLWYSAAEIPEIETAPESLCCLLAPEALATKPWQRERFAVIQQAHFGSRDLAFGSRYYRPEHAGYNSAEDVGRIATYLASVDIGRWAATDLVLLPEFADDEERAEELEYVRDWFPALRELYQRAFECEQLMVCETLAPASTVVD